MRKISGKVALLALFGVVVFGGVFNVQAKDFSLKLISSRSKKVLKRPRPKGLDFHSVKERLVAYIKSHPTKAKQLVEKERIQEINKCRSELEELMSHTAFSPSEKIEVEVYTTGGRTKKVKGKSVSANQNSLMIRNKKGRVVSTVKWEEIPYPQFVAFYDFYLNLRVEFASGDEEGQAAEDAKAYADEAAEMGYRVALLCDWYGDIKNARKYALIAVKFDEAYRQKLETMLTYLVKKRRKR